MQIASGFGGSCNFLAKFVQVVYVMIRVAEIELRPRMVRRAQQRAANASIKPSICPEISRVLFYCSIVVHKSIKDVTSREQR